MEIELAQLFWAKNSDKIHFSWVQKFPMYMLPNWSARCTLRHWLCNTQQWQTECHWGRQGIVTFSHHKTRRLAMESESHDGQSVHRISLRELLYLGTGGRSEHYLQNIMCQPGLSWAKHGQCSPISKSSRPKKLKTIWKNWATQ